MKKKFEIEINDTGKTNMFCIRGYKE